MQPSRILTLTSTLFCAAIIALLLANIVGCKSVDLAQVATPARIEAVTALGTYLGGQRLVRSGQRAEIEQALAGLQAIQAAGKRDMVAVAAALSSAGIKWIETPEGVLAFGLASSVFTDKYGPETVLDTEYADAVLSGSIRGLTLALGPQQRGAQDAGSTMDTLASEAEYTRHR